MFNESPLYDPLQGIGSLIKKVFSVSWEKHPPHNNKQTNLQITPNPQKSWEASTCG